MFTNDDKERIRAEEIYRDEVRKELEAQKQSSSKKKTIWEILNSSFALWFLSSVVVASITALYTWYTENEKEEAKKSEIQRHLDVEISNRMALASSALRRAQVTVGKGGYIKPVNVYLTAVGYLDNTLRDVDVSVYPDLKSRTFRSLVVELNSIVPSLEQDELKNIIGRYENLAEIASSSEENTQLGIDSLKASYEAVGKSMKIVGQELLLRRWRTPLFDSTIVAK